jgi:ATP/maltotriose-dependent transcriptional regulator MalT
MTLSVAAGHLAAFVEDLADNLPEMERLMRRSVESLRAAGETGYLSTSAATHAEALFRLGRFEEALEATRLSEETAAADDVASQSQWRSVRAKIAAAEGRLDEADRLARESTAISDGTDHLNQIGYSYLALAVVLHAAGKRAEAEAAAGRSLEAMERKGNVVWAGKARRLLEELAAGD